MVALGGGVVALGACIIAPGGACMVALGGMHGCSWGGVCGCSWGACMVAPGGCAWLLGGVCMVAARGHAWLLLGGVWDTTRYGDTIKERAVRILLECILVLQFYNKMTLQ